MRRSAQAGSAARTTRRLDAVGTPWVLAGMALLAAFAAQAALGWRWGWLSAWQEVELYKQLTGLALVVFIGLQWRLTAARMEGAVQSARRLLDTHRDWGALAPLLFYVHAESLGHAYIRAMSLAFFALVTLGLLHRPLARANRRWLSAAWLVTHVMLASALVLLIGYHAFNAFYYE